MKNPAENEAVLSFGHSWQDRAEAIPGFPWDKVTQAAMGSCTFLSSGLFITNVKSMTFLTRIKCLSLKSVSQISSLGKKQDRGE